MTISSTNRKAGPFAGNDVQTVFPFAFKVFEATDVVVTRADPAMVESVLVLGVDYSVSLNGDQDGAPGGVVTLLAGGLATGYTLALTSAVAALQGVSLTNGGGFFPTVFNGVFDRLTILVQQIQEQITRTFRVPVTTVGVTDFRIPVLAGAVLQWAPDGSRLVAQSLPDLSLSLALPDQGGHADHALFSNGVSALWRAPALTDVAGLASWINFLNARDGDLAAKVSAASARMDAIDSRMNFLISAAAIF